MGYWLNVKQFMENHVSYRAISISPRRGHGLLGWLEFTIAAQKITRLLRIIIMKKKEKRWSRDSKSDEHQRRRKKGSVCAEAEVIAEIARLLFLL